MEDRNDLPSNSYRSREKPQKESNKPVAHGKYVRRRKSIRERMKDFFYEPEGGDGYDYVYEDIVRPAVLDMLGDISHNVIGAVRDAVDTALFGGVKSSRRRNGYYRTSYDDYDEYWNRERRSRRRRRDDPEDDDRRVRSRRRSDDVVAQVETREEAVNLIKSMQRRVDLDGCATVLDFYNDADMSTLSTDDNYGWNRAHPFEATLTRIRGGEYLVEPCPPIWLDR